MKLAQQNNLLTESHQRYCKYIMDHISVKSMHECEQLLMQHHL